MIRRGEKPRIGLLGVMLDLYESMYPDVKERQGEFAHELIAGFGNEIDFQFPGPVWNRSEIEGAVANFNRSDLDGIMIVMLTYCPSFRAYNALRNNRLPILLANTQPLSTVRSDWNMWRLTQNQGVHGAQDMGNALIRMGQPSPVITEDWRSDRFRSYVKDWARAAHTAKNMTRMRIGQVGQMPTMGDIQVSTATMMAKLGPLVEQSSFGTIVSEFDKVPPREVDSVVAENRRNFEIDSRLSDESHRYAAQLQVAIHRWLEANDYDGFSIQFSAPGEDGRIKQLHMMAASNLMAKGYGYSAEGDANAATLMTTSQLLAGDAHFTEMYFMDFERDSVLMSHMGEGNWKVARKDRPVRLIDRPLGIGGLENPPTVLFSAEPGPATLASLIVLPEEKFRLVVCHGEVLDEEELQDVEMPYFHFKPANGVRRCLDGWLEAGGSHHQVMNLGDSRRLWQLLCRITQIEYVEV